MKNVCAERDRDSVCLSDNDASLETWIELFEKEKDRSLSPPTLHIPISN